MILCPNNQDDQKVFEIHVHAHTNTQMQIDAGDGHCEFSLKQDVGHMKHDTAASSLWMSQGSHCLPRKIETEKTPGRTLALRRSAQESKYLGGVVPNLWFTFLPHWRE